MSVADQRPGTSLLQRLLTQKGGKRGQRKKGVKLLTDQFTDFFSTFFITTWLQMYWHAFGMSFFLPPCCACTRSPDGRPDSPQKRERRNHDDATLDSDAELGDFSNEN